MVLALPVVVASGVACSSFTTAGPAAATDAGADADSVAVGDDAPAPADAGPDAPPTIDVVHDSDFESGACAASWGGTNASLTDVDGAHAGAHACQVCASDVTQPFVLTQVVKRAAQPGQMLRGSGYFRMASRAGGSVILSVATFLGGVQKDATQSTLQMLTADWQGVDATLTPSQDYDALGVIVLVHPVQGASSACFVVDDLELRAPPVLAH